MSHYKLADTHASLVCRSGGTLIGIVAGVIPNFKADPPRVVDHVTVGDSPEGLPIKPKGGLAVSVEARGSNMP